MERFAIKIDKSLRANLYKICRLCGIDNPDKIKVRDDANIVNLEDGEPELWKKVFDCIGLMITKDDKMPQFMCTLCVDKINDFFEFREMCYATDGQTRKLLGIKGEPKPKVASIVPSSSIDLKFEDIKEPFPEVTPQRASRKRRNADMEIIKDVKLDIIDDIKPSTTNLAASATKKKRMKLSTMAETETKIEPDTRNALKINPKAELPLSKKRLKAEPTVKENKKEMKSAKLTQLMKKKLKVESPSVATSEQLQTTKKKKVDLIKPKKLPQLVVKAEKLKKGMLDTKIKEETPATPTSDPSSIPASSAKAKSKCKEKCSICSEGFVNKIHLDKHVKATHIPTIQRYHCVHCNETLKKNMEIKNHNLWHKLSKTPFQCGKCSENSCSIYTYSKHIRDCSQVAYLDTHIPDWHCPDCSGIYETTYLFNVHSCVAKGLVCPGCEKSLKWKEDYFKHIPTCAEAFNRIPPYMTSNVQVKNEAELPTSPIPPVVPITLPTTAVTNATVQSTTSTRVTPPQMDSNQCVVIPGNISLHEETGSASPSKSSRKGKRITKKDLKRFDKLLKSTMTTLVSIKHEPSQGEDAIGDGEKPSSSEIKEHNEAASPPPESPPGSPCGGDDFHYNGDDSDSADEQPPTKPVGTIKQEIIDEGYRDLYNNIEVNIKHEIEANKNTGEDSSQKKTAEALAGEPAVAQKPILKLKITKEHGTLNSVLMDSPKSEKKKKKKKRKEDRNKSPEKEERIITDNTTAATTGGATVESEVPVEKDIAIDITDLINQNPPVESDKPMALEAEEEPPMPLPEIIQIKQEISVPEADEIEEEASSQNTPSIVAASSGSLQISSVSEGVIFHGTDENEEAMSQEAQASVAEQANFESEESGNWVEPIPSMELSLAPKELTSPPVDDAASIHYPIMDEEIDVKPRLEDLIPMLQIASVASVAEVIDKPMRKPVKRKRRQTTAKSNPIPKIVSVSSGTDSYHAQPDSAEDLGKKKAENDDDVFNFSQIKIKEEIVDNEYEEDSSVTRQDEEEEEVIDDETINDEEEEEEEAEKVDEEQGIEDDVQIQQAISTKQAEENAYIANIDFENLTIKQEKEYIDDGLENSASFEENEDVDDDEEEDECSENDSEESSSEDDSTKSDSESEREYRELPSEDEENGKNDEKLAVASQMKPAIAVKERERPTSQTQLGLQILTVHSDFSEPQSSKKTESEQVHSDGKLSPNSTTDMELNENQSKPSTDLKITDNLSGKTNNADTSVEMENCEMALQPTHIPTTDIQITCVQGAEQSSIPQLNSLDHTEMADNGNLMHDADKNLTEICDDLERRANEEIAQNPCSYSKSKNISINLSRPAPSQEVSLDKECLETTMAMDVDRGCYPGVSNIDSENRLLPPTDVVSINQCFSADFQSANEASKASRDCRGTESAEDAGKTTDLSGVELTTQCMTQEFSAERLVDTNVSAQPSAAENLSELPPVADILQNNSSVQTSISSHLPKALSSANSYSFGDHINYKGEHQAPSSLENTLQADPSVMSNHTPNSFENTNILMNLGNDVGNSISNLDPPYNHDNRRQEPDPNSLPRSESVFNIPPSRMEFQQFSTTPGSSYGAYHCNSDPSGFTDYLTPPTAGQLQTSLVQQPTVNESTELSSNSLTNLSTLSEEVQNLLNEDTVAVNNFNFNNSVLRARSAAAAAAAPNDPVPVFNDFENLNEIAENNNNANIERELQDELGNVLADAIADRSNDDEVHDNNVMNENRANFDIT